MYTKDRALFSGCHHFKRASYTQTTNPVMQEQDRQTKWFMKYSQS